MRRVSPRLVHVFCVLVFFAGIATARAARLDPDRVLGGARAWPTGLTSCAEVSLAGQQFGPPGSNVSFSLSLARNGTAWSALDVDIRDVPDLFDAVSCNSLISDFECEVYEHDGIASVSLSTGSATIPPQLAKRKIAELTFQVAGDPPPYSATLAIVGVTANDSKGQACVEPGPEITFLVTRCPDGTPETESDDDGVPDCLDGCPFDSDKLDPGICGCGVLDDPTNSDDDALADCVDPCPQDSHNDVDGDAVCADVDNCPDVANEDQLDFDEDAIGDPCV
jgi:hypothetical protein